MATPHQIEKQVQLERDQISLGIKRLHKTTKDLEDKSYASATIYGISSIDVLLPLVMKKIDDTTYDRLTRGTGHQFQLIKDYVSKLESFAAAAISCKILFDKVFSYKLDSNTIVNVSEAIGQAIENECQIRYYENTAPGLINVLKLSLIHI